MPARHGKRSTRTLIEINHDHLHRLMEEGVWQYILIKLTSHRLAEALNSGQQPEIVPGVRVVVQRHESNELIVNLR